MQPICNVISTNYQLPQSRTSSTYIRIGEKEMMIDFHDIPFEFYIMLSIIFWVILEIRTVNEIKRIVSKEKIV